MLHLTVPLIKRSLSLKPENKKTFRVHIVLLKMALSTIFNFYSKIDNLFFLLFMGFTVKIKTPPVSEWYGSMQRKKTRFS